MGWILVAGLLLALWAWTQRAPAPVVAVSDMPAPSSRQLPDDVARGLPGFLPMEAHATVQSIERGGPFPHRQDGGVFQNRERLLPQMPRGYYREYTVPTPTARDRGARRIVSGGDPPREYFYTDDHYRSFRRFSPPTEPSR